MGLVLKSSWPHTEQGGVLDKRGRLPESAEPGELVYSVQLACNIRMNRLTTLNIFINLRIRRTL